jgi:uncharacterized phage protein gp47/JayE
MYLDWLAPQLLPDTAEGEWLRRHGDIWVGGAKAATYAEGSVTLTGSAGTVIPSGTRLAGASGIEYETTAAVTLGGGDTAASIRALTAGSAGNLASGSRLTVSVAISGLDGAATVVTLSGGADDEADEDLRARVLLRIRQPPMGGAAHDYEQWALSIPGVTRAWCAPLEMGIGTVTLRFMMDDLRAGSGGFPTSGDVATVQAIIDAKRPVAVKDFFVEAPIAEPVSFAISDLDLDSSATRAAIAASVSAMLADRAAPARHINGIWQPAQTIHREWVSAAILKSSGVDSFDLTMSDHVMPNAGCLATLGTITYV